MVVFWILAAFLILILLSGGYVFFTACRRKKELPWFVKEELEKTPYGKYYDCIVDADRWLAEHGQSVYITSHDGLRLHAHWVPAKNPKGTMLLMHGYRSTKLVDFGVAFAYYHERGFHVLAPDQRSHGRSEGNFITFGVKESQDVLSWIEFHNQSFGALPLFLSGLSMGASTVMFLADEKLPGNVRGIIADCGFCSPAAIISKVFRDVTHLPAMPSIFCADLFARFFAGFSLFEKDSRKTLAHTRLPTLLIHGKDDHFVPCTMTEESYAACTGEKELLLVDGAGHGVSFLVDHDRYSDMVEAFLLKNLEGSD